ncbi:hypothetical protein [Polaribacter marinivivus]|jgi:hypothetical protein|uniref:DUF904 domain-containing protein n=1 Tax=Polaribacter marinivivus TaxID=1524260 RepID=A0ABV8RBW4_9FLAO|nr:hypothetical protein [uncultured Polaribacter sp.]
MSNILETIHSLEDKLNKLLSNYEFLKNENNILLQNNTKLQQQLLEKSQFIENQQKEFDLLKVAKTIEGSSTNTKDTKLKINALIREIDKCIIQLQE